MGCIFRRMPIDWYDRWLQQLSNDTSSLQRSLALQQRQEARARLSQEVTGDFLELLRLRQVNHYCDVGRREQQISAASNASAVSPTVCILLISDDVASVSADFRARGFPVVTSAELLQSFRLSSSEPPMRVHSDVTGLLPGLVAVDSRLNTGHQPLLLLTLRQSLLCLQGG